MKLLLPFRCIPKQRPSGLSVRGKFGAGYYANKDYPKQVRAMRSAGHVLRQRSKWGKLRAPIVLAATISFDGNRHGDIDNLMGTVMDAMGESKRGHHDGVLYDKDADVVAIVAIRNSPKVDIEAIIARMHTLMDELDTGIEGDIIELVADEV